MTGCQGLSGGPSARPISRCKSQADLLTQENLFLQVLPEFQDRDPGVRFLATPMANILSLRVFLVLFLGDGLLCRVGGTIPVHMLSPPNQGFPVPFI